MNAAVMMASVTRRRVVTLRTGHDRSGEGDSSEESNNELLVHVKPTFPGCFALTRGQAFSGAFPDGELFLKKFVRNCQDVLLPLSRTVVYSGVRKAKSERK